MNLIPPLFKKEWFHVLWHEEKTRMEGKRVAAPALYRMLFWKLLCTANTNIICMKHTVFLQTWTVFYPLLSYTLTSTCTPKKNGRELQLPANWYPLSKNVSGILADWYVCHRPGWLWSLLCHEQLLNLPYHLPSSDFREHSVVIINQVFSVIVLSRETFWSIFVRLFKMMV